MPIYVPIQSIPIVSLVGIPGDVKGIWSLWQIGIGFGDKVDRKIFACFVHEDGRILMPTAKRVWDILLYEEFKVEGYLDNIEGGDTYERMFTIIKECAKPVYDELVRLHKIRIESERKKTEYAFNARKRVIEKVGLAEVKNYRLAKLDDTMKAWEKDVQEREMITPELIPLILLQIQKS